MNLWVSYKLNYNKSD